ncbi:MAG TPA: formate dehydrogenase accessory protein FdhE [Humidesulfovibrio sp.]|uniref:formate dehydrogenase accessory protein FdhE n=1 Tax=Humidesulfovibrio sp. TaxID=2910988 RepID=UPI002CE1CCCF|nr:formate dehydrogenase accessory protein FdhE [Humidesulfovibrio sp.]HWR03970.1 formate dehydrogenase accessory protein FdhE [Humidesulfovibrio sp.]
MHCDDHTYARLASAKLALIRSQEILPEELIALVERVLPLLRQARAEAQVSLPPVEACATAEAMFAGSPLLLRQDFPFDLKQALGLIPTLLDILEQSGEAAAEAAQTLRQAMESGALDPEAALRGLAAGDDALFAHWRERLPGSPRALDFLATCALLPSLNVAAEQLAPRLPENLPHEHGHCPLCGSLPYISLLRDKEGKRYGVCSFCGYEHRLRRIACAYCDEADQNKLKLFRVAEYPGVRVDVCDTCNMYIKTLDHREMDNDTLAALDDMASVALDVLAQQQGYRRPTLSAWGF